MKQLLFIGILFTSFWACDSASKDNMQNPTEKLVIKETAELVPEIEPIETVEKDTILSLFPEFAFYVGTKYLVVDTAFSKYKIKGDFNKTGRQTYSVEVQDESIPEYLKQYIGSEVTILSFDGEINYAKIVSYKLISIQYGDGLIYSNPGLYEDNSIYDSTEFYSGIGGVIFVAELDTIIEEQHAFYALIGHHDSIIVSKEIGDEAIIKKAEKVVLSDTAYQRIEKIYAKEKAKLDEEIQTKLFEQQWLDIAETAFTIFVVNTDTLVFYQKSSKPYCGEELYEAAIGGAFLYKNNTLEKLDLPLDFKEVYHNVIPYKVIDYDNDGLYEFLINDYDAGVYILKQQTDKSYKKSGYFIPNYYCGC